MEDKTDPSTRNEKKSPLQKLSITWYFIFSVAVAAIGSGFQHGYNTGVLNSPQEVITSWINEKLNDTSPTKHTLNLIWSEIVSIFALGGLCGGALTGLVANKLGRKFGLMANNILAGCAGLLMGISKSVGVYHFLIAGRFVVGVNAGLNAGLCPMYLSEISCVKIRGAVGSIYQLIITMSILISQILGLSSVLGTTSKWPFLLYLIIAVAMGQALLLFFLPESPKLLLIKEKKEEATKACNKLAGDDGDKALTEIENELKKSQGLPEVKFSQMFTVKKLRTPLIILTCLMIAQQLSGINAVMFYSTEIFKMGHMTLEGAQWSTVGVGLVNVITTLVSVFLIEMVGRKILLLTGFAGMAITTICLLTCLAIEPMTSTTTYLSLVFVYSFVFFFALGAGSIPWFIGSELFETGTRPIAISIAVPVNWFFNFIVALCFLPLKSVMGPYVFIVFIVFQTITFVFVLFMVPETKNKPIEDITEKFN